MQMFKEMNIEYWKSYTAFLISTFFANCEINPEIKYGVDPI